jgi:predicted GNAT family acetyltransferase
MKQELENLLLKNNVDKQRFELQVDKETAYIEYKRKGDRIFLIHTEIPAALKGTAAGPALVEKAFLNIEENKQKLIPYCPFVRAYLKRHPQWDRITVEESA